ncbi:MAG: U32 family peptidase [Gammaproteobacteria bacterium]|nr:U32 family peptidase [Gammaproteobacteria bacterium]
MSDVMKLSIGPIQYFWERQRVLDFYQQAADSAAEIIYLGEVICSKRRLVKPADWFAIGEELKQNGQEVVLSSLTLLEAASEMSSLKKLCRNESFMVEANDISAVQLLSVAGEDFVTGPSFNIYNDRSLRLLAGKGMKRWVLPVELGLDTLRDLQANRPEGVETEVFALGRLPLAYSARCYTARSHNLPKDDCQYKCLDYPDGAMLKTREDQEFLVLNGIQTQSALTHQVLDQLPDLKSLKVDVLRISPQYEHTFEIIDIFDDARRGAALPPLGEKLLGLLPLGACNGYIVEQAGMNLAPGSDHDTQQTV